MTKYVYLFTEGNADMRNLLGGKGANLAEMTNIGLPVPQGFTITTEACTKYYEDGRTINDEIQSQINEYIVKMEEITGKKFGDKENPLLVSVRSGARASMPGMMDTILNLGLNEEVVNVLAEKSNNPRWAWDCYRRFIQMYSDVVMEVGKKYFEQLIDKMKEEKNVKLDVELTADDLKELAREFKEEYKSKIGKDFPDDPKEQLMGAIKAVFRSWDNPRANVYRRDNDIPYSWGTAVNVQSMAFGNMGDDCGTGVAFTRDPATGEKGLFGEFLTNAQGEDVVAGVRTPMKITEMADKFPEAFEEFVREFGFEFVFGLSGPAMAHGARVAGRGDVGGAAHEIDFVRVLDEAHAVERLAQIADLVRRVPAGPGLGPHRVERGDDFCVPCRIVAERVPEHLVVGDQLGEQRFEGAERIGFVETKRIARGVGAVAEAFPDLAFLVLVAAEEDGPLPAAADQHDHRFRLGEAGEVPEVAVEAVGVVRVAVAHALRRGRDDGDAVADVLEQRGAACRVGFVFHGFLRSS